MLLEKSIESATKPESNYIDPIDMQIGHLSED